MRVVISEHIVYAVLRDDFGEQRAVFVKHIRRGVFVKDVASHNYDICVLLLYERENVPDG